MNLCMYKRQLQPEALLKLDNCLISYLPILVIIEILDQIKMHPLYSDFKKWKDQMCRLFNLTFAYGGDNMMFISIILYTLEIIVCLNKFIIMI